MNGSRKPLTVVLYQDVLCAWCYIAETRLDALKAEFGDAVHWKIRPYPLRLQEALPSERELADWVEEIRRARQEPEGARLSADLWTSNDPPRSSIPALAALEAAKLQGLQARHRLARAMQRAALEQGFNVTRPDVVFELATTTALEMNRFAAAYKSEETRRLIVEEHRLAVHRGIKGVPSLVIGGKWMVSGLRETREYRELIMDCLNKIERAGPLRAERTLH